MKDLKSKQNEYLEDTLKRIEEFLEKPEDANKESIERWLGINPASELLIPFTGYYNLNTVENSFLSIDTNDVYVNYTKRKNEIIRIHFAIVTISLSLDGKKSSQYSFNNNASFDGVNLVIPGVLNIALARGYKNGVLVTFSGNIHSNPVFGSTCFNPVALPIFIGDYKELETQKTVVSITDSAILFDFGLGNGLENIPIFSYDPAMYVVQLYKANANYSLMLGTEGLSGKACYIIGGTNSGLAVTIP